jgi:hypothetical protein
MKKSTIVKIFLTILFFIVIFAKVDFFDILQIALSVNIFYIFSALILVPVLYFIRTVRWNMFLHSIGISIPISRSFRILLIGNFYGLITPGKVGEVGRAYHLSEKKVLTVPTIIMEKIVDICTLVILSFLTIAIYFQNNVFMQICIFLSGTAMIFGIFLLTNKKFLFSIMKVFGIGSEDCDQFAQNFRILLYDYPLVGKSFLLSLVYYGINYLIGYFVILSAGFNPITSITLPIIILIGNIPFTISGLGLRESIGSLLFVYLGDTAADGFVFAFLLFILITVIPGIFGYILTMSE